MREEGKVVFPPPSLLFPSLALLCLPAGEGDSCVVLLQAVHFNRQREREERRGAGDGGGGREEEGLFKKGNHEQAYLDGGGGVLA